MNRIKISILIAAIMLTGCVTNPKSTNEEVASEKEKKEEVKNQDIAKIIESFGESTKLVADNVNIVFTDINSAQLNTDISYLASTGNYIPPEKRKLPAKGLSQSNLSVVYEPVEGPFKAINALSQYGAALSTLAKAGSKDEIKLASANLYSAAIQADAAYQEATGGQPKDNTKTIAAIVSTAVTEIGAFYTDRKRNIALTNIIKGADPTIEKITNDLLTALSDHQGAQFARNRKEMLNFKVQEYNYKIMAGPTSLEWREGEIKKLVALQGDINSSEKTIENARSAVEAVIQAQQALLKASTEKNVDKDLLKKIINLNAKAENVKSYRNMLLKCDSGKFKIETSGGVVCEKAS